MALASGPLSSVSDAARARRARVTHLRTSGWRRRGVHPSMVAARRRLRVEQEDMSRAVPHGTASGQRHSNRNTTPGQPIPTSPLAALVAPTRASISRGSRQLVATARLAYVLPACVQRCHARQRPATSWAGDGRVQVCSAARSNPTSSAPPTTVPASNTQPRCSRAKDSRQHLCTTCSASGAPSERAACACAALGPCAGGEGLTARAMPQHLERPPSRHGESRLRERTTLSGSLPPQCYTCDQLCRAAPCDQRLARHARLPLLVTRRSH
jgi:hypothetical protein